MNKTFNIYWYSVKALDHLKNQTAELLYQCSLTWFYQYRILKWKDVILFTFQNYNILEITMFRSTISAEVSTGISVDCANNIALPKSKKKLINKTFT